MNHLALMLCSKNRIYITIAITASLYVNHGLNLQIKAIILKLIGLRTQITCIVD